MGGTEMMHFQALRWSEFVNRADPVDPRTAMQTHRGTRRKRLGQTGSLWQRVTKAATVEPSYQPSVEKVCAVKAAFATAGFSATRQETGSVIQIVHDSFLQPILAGIRTAPAPKRTRQLLYRADPYQIDLQIELLPESNRLAVTGQLLDVSRPEMVGRDVQVMLSDGRQHIVNSVTNQFGEFRAEIENSGDLELSFLSPGRKPIVVLLRGALDQLSGAKE
jgi:hypothetical protein